VKQLAAIASNTFKETIRDRVLAVIVVFALVMIAGGLWLGAISLGEQGRMMKDFGLVAVTGFGLIVAVFIAASLVHKEVEKRTVFVLFSKPVSRVAFITGKFFGLCGTMAVVLAGMGLFLFALVWLLQGTPSFMVLAAVAMIYVQLLAIMAVTIFFSTLGSAILASVLGICVFVAGQLSHNVLALTRLGDNPVTEAFSWVIYVLIPNLTAIDVKAGVVGEETLAWGQIGLWVLYLLAYVVVVLALATMIFRRKEF
jgi:ABC-2 type transport system permease protein